MGATNTENTTQNRSHGGEPDKMTLCSYNIASQIFKVPRRKKTKKNRRRRRKGEEKTVTFFFCLFFTFRRKGLDREWKNKRKKKGRPKENWERKKTVPTICASNKEKTKSSAQHARTFSRSEPSVTMFTLSTSATVSSVRASRLLCVSAFSNGCHVALSLVSFFCAKT